MSKKALLFIFILSGIIDCFGMKSKLNEIKKKRSSEIDKYLSLITVKKGSKDTIHKGLNLISEGLDSLFDVGIKKIEDVFVAIDKTKYPDEEVKREKVTKEYETSIVSDIDVIFSKWKMGVFSFGPFFIFFRKDQFIQLMEQKRKDFYKKSKKLGNPSLNREINIENEKIQEYEKNKSKPAERRIMATYIKIREALREWKTLPYDKYKSVVDNLQKGIDFVYRELDYLLGYITGKKEDIKPKKTGNRDVFVSIKLDAFGNTMEKSMLQAKEGFFNKILEILDILKAEKYVRVATNLLAKNLDRQAFGEATYKIGRVRLIKSYGSNTLNLLNDIKKFIDVVEYVNYKNQIIKLYNSYYNKTKFILSKVNTSLPYSFIDQLLKATESINKDLRKYFSKIVISLIDNIFSSKYTDISRRMNLLEGSSYLDKYFKFRENFAAYKAELNKAKDFKRVATVFGYLIDLYGEIKGEKDIDTVLIEGVGKKVKKLPPVLTKREEKLWLRKKIQAALRESEKHVARWVRRVATDQFMTKPNLLFLQGKYRRAIETLNKDLFEKDVKVLTERRDKADKLRDELSKLTGDKPKFLIPDTDIDKILRGEGL